MQKHALLFALDAPGYAALTPAERWAIQQLPVAKFLRPGSLTGPAPAEMQRVAQELGCTEWPAAPTAWPRDYAPTDLLVVVSHPTAALDAAQKLGLDTVLWDPTGRYPASPATFTITQPAQLAGVLYGFMPWGGCRRRGTEQCQGTCGQRLAQLPQRDNVALAVG